MSISSPSFNDHSYSHLNLRNPISSLSSAFSCFQTSCSSKSRSLTLFSSSSYGGGTGKVPDGDDVIRSPVKFLRKILESPGINLGLACFDTLSVNLVERAGFDFCFTAGPWFQMSHVSYPEVADLTEAIKGLSETQSRYKKARCDLFASIFMQGWPMHQTPNFCFGKTDACVRISPLAESLVWRIEIFSNRSDLLSFEESVEVAQIMVEAIDESNNELVLRCIEITVSNLMTSFEEGKYSCEKSMAYFVSHFSASWTYFKVVLLGVSFLEREKRYSDAINLLRRLLNTFISDGRLGLLGSKALLIWNIWDSWKRVYKLQKTVYLIHGLVQVQE